MTSFLSRFFLIPIFCQTILLHSRFAIRFKWLRLALAIPAIYFSARITWIYRLEPLAESIAVNFRWGIFSPFFILRSIEYAFANAEEYEWVGFKHKRDESEGIRVKQQTGTGNITNGNERRIENGTALPSRNGSWSNYIDSDVGGSDIEHIRREKREDDWITVLGKSTALFTSLRGHGYAFGPTFDPASSHRRVSNTEFIRRNVINLFINHCISTFCIIILITPHLSLVHLFSFVLSSKLAAFVSSSLAYLSVGCSLLAQMNLGHDFFALSYLIAITFLRLRAIIPASSRFRPLPFDSREWPPLFNSPFLMTSVTSFWGVRWHSFFRKPFLKVGYWPVAYMFRKLGLSAIGKILGVYAVFALSAAMHHLALHSALYQLPVPDLPFYIRNGGPIFFMIQATAVILESTFTKLTHRKVGGLYGRIWSYLIVVAIGMYTAGRSWTLLGFMGDLPRVEEWSWQRFVIPSVALLPGPIFTQR